MLLLISTVSEVANIAERNNSNNIVISLITEEMAYMNKQIIRLQLKVALSSTALHKKSKFSRAENYRCIYTR